MAFIPIPNCAKVTLQWIVAGQVVEITLSFTRTGGWGATDLGNLTLDLMDWYTDQMKTKVSEQATLVNINATDQSSESGPSIDLPVTSGGQGTKTGNPLPNNATGALKFLTDQRGRSYRGRIFWPTLTSNQNSGPVLLLGSEVAAMIVAFVNLASHLVLSNATHVVASRFTGGAPRTTGVATPVTAYGMDQSIDSQRRRLAGRGI